MDGAYRRTANQTDQQQKDREPDQGPVQATGVAIFAHIVCMPDGVHGRPRIKNGVSSFKIGRQNMAELKNLVSGSDIWKLDPPPRGSFSCFLRYETGEPSWDFFDRMVTRKPEAVEFVPGSAFHECAESYIRIGLGLKPEIFAEALVHLDAGAREYSSK